MSRPDAQPPAHGFRVGDDLCGYAATIDDALRAGRDVSGEQVISHPDGQSHDLRHRLADGQNIAVDGHDTSFGPVSYRIDSHPSTGYLDVHANTPPVRDLTIHIRPPAGYAVDVDGDRPSGWDPRSDAVRVPAVGRSVTVCVPAARGHVS